MPMMIMLMGPSMTLTESMAPLTRDGRRRWVMNSTSPMSMERMLRFPKMFRRDTVRSPLRSMRQWVHKREICTIMYILVKSRYSLPRMAPTTGIRRFTQLE